jgi:glycosyltransferase involved in cell wall biosynthesis
MNTPSLSIVMASHNDANQTVLTLASIRETAPENVEVVIVDDCSATPLVHYIHPDERTQLVVNRHRCGCGPSRHIGALHAKGDWLLLCDSHMRFSPGWYEGWATSNHTVPLDELFNTIFCATCLGIDSKHMDLNAPVAEYHGATMNLAGPDRYKPSEQQVFEAVWLPREPQLEDGADIPAIMGAAYFISRDWFFTLSCLRFLRIWGGDEQALSIASWLAGGSVRLAKSVRIGHKFLIDKKEVQTFGVPPGYVIWNKLHLINSLLPKEIAGKLSNLLLAGKDTRDIECAKKLYKDDYHITAAERVRYSNLFTRLFEWYCEKFHIPIP